MQVLSKCGVSTCVLQPRDEFIARLLSSLKIEPEGSVSSLARRDNDVCDSWEDRASDEVWLIRGEVCVKFLHSFDLVIA